MNKEVLLTNIERCVGCNKCIAKCLVNANIAFQKDGENKVKVDPFKCIHCGACIEVCDHKAREFTDDTEAFFHDLKQGVPISVIVAPSIQFNFPHYKRFYGYLKSLHVKLIYDVAFGANIATWAYLKIMEEQNLTSVIAQSCPVIVNYIQKYRPNLIGKLVPIQSPMICTGIYLKKYKKIQEKIAFISPCIGKIDEIKEKQTNKIVHYNVTYEKIEKYLEKNHINLKNYPEIGYDDIDCGIGFVFSRPGGLSENVKVYKKDVWIRQVEGPKAYRYLDEYSQRVSAGKPLPFIVDILNCQWGCNLGTAANKSISIDDVDYQVNELKKEKIALCENTKTSFESFNQSLELGDFIRKYEDKSEHINDNTLIDLEDIFNQLHKTTEESRKLNCYACGFGSCIAFAQAVYQGENHINNCIDFNRKELVSKKEDISETNKEVRHLHYLATHDFLTNIPNRYYLEEYLKDLIMNEADQIDKSALLFIDLDNFKVVNDSFGHASGDQILLSFVELIKKNLRSEDFLARLGGDEFAVVLKNTSLERAKEIANQFLQNLWIGKFDFDGNQVTINVTASIGITMVDGTLDTQTLFSYADVALYAAKDEGKNRIFVIHSDGDKKKLSESNHVILQINTALKENRFTLHFQPIVDMQGKIVHHEALLRMLGQDGKLIFPNEFMRTAERFGLMSQIDQWVVNSAIDILCINPKMSIFVNISASSLIDRELLKFIESRIHESGIAPTRIGFEITETAVIRDLDQVEHWIRRLKVIGCKFALDDFGAGFLSFAHLQKLPVDYLKIDGSFIRNIDVDPINKALVQAMNSVAHALGKATIAEYVENEKIWEILHELQIDCGQGYFLGRPAPLADKRGGIVNLLKMPWPRESKNIV